MTDRIVINGIGPVGGFGAGTEDLWNALHHPAGPNEVVKVELPSGEAEVPRYAADTDLLLEYVTKRKVRRLGRFARLAVLGSYMALEDAGMLGGFDPEEVGVVVASGYGPTDETFEFLDQINEEGDECVSPTLFSNAAHSVAQTMISIMLGITGPALTVSEFRMSVPMAVVNAIQWLREERVRYVLLGAVEEHCDARTYCHERLYGPRQSGPMNPLKYGENTAVLGEGTVFFVLSLEGPGRSYGYLNDVLIGSGGEVESVIGDGGPLILAADGHPQCGKLYERYVPSDAQALAYTAVYGSMPVGPAFDVAIASLACRKGVLPVLDSGETQGTQSSETDVKDVGVRCQTLDADRIVAGFSVTPG